MCAIVVIGNHFDVPLLINRAYEICTLDSVYLPSLPQCSISCSVQVAMGGEGV